MASKQPRQLRLDLGRLSSQQFSPVGAAAQGAREYTAAQGRTYSSRGLRTMQVNPRKGFAIQHAYRQNQQAETPTIRGSYEKLRQEVHQQYNYMTSPTGMGIKHEVVEHDPYVYAGDQGARAMAEDVRRGRIKTLATTATGGHEYFSDEENDKFRAVHDVFGHAAIGRGFSRHGEEAAWHSHVQMFSPEAREAMTSETRGQNSHLNFGTEPTPTFPNQGPGSKLVGMPKWAQQPLFKDRRR